MLRNGLFGEGLFDDWMRFPTFHDFDDVEKKLYGRHAAHVMKTDVHENDEGYEVDIDLPGFKKDELNLRLENGYLTVSAAKGLDKDEKTRRVRLSVRSATPARWNAASTSERKSPRKM